MNKTPQFETEKLSLLMSIVDHRVGDVFVAYYQSLDVNVQIQVLGSGTVSEELKNILGLQEVKKDIIFTLMKSQLVDQALQYAETRFRLGGKHKGIAFSIPFQSVMGVSVYKILSNTPVLEPKKEYQQNGKK